MERRKEGPIEKLFKEVDLAENEMRGEEYFKSPDHTPDTEAEAGQKVYKKLSHRAGRVFSSVLAGVSFTLHEIGAVLRGEDEHY